jgi:hypothetical protein
MAPTPLPIDSNLTTEQLSRDGTQADLHPTALGQALRAIRRRIEASGLPLLSLQEIEREVAERRAEKSGC